MLKALRNLQEGRSAWFGFAPGQSTSGGLWGTEIGLRRRGLMDHRHQITEAGWAKLEELKERVVLATPEGEAVATRDGPDCMWSIAYPWADAPRPAAPLGKRLILKRMADEAKARVLDQEARADLLGAQG